MPAMTPDQWRRFLSEGTRTAKIATTRQDGRPHVAPVWFLLDGESIVFTTGKNTVKGRGLARDPRVAICIDDETPPFAMVVIEGTATLGENLDEVRDWATRLGERYMGADRAEEFGRRNGVPGELLVRVQIDKLIAFDRMAG